MGSNPISRTKITVSNTEVFDTVICFLIANLRTETEKIYQLTKLAMISGVVFDLAFEEVYPVAANGSRPD